LGMPERKKTRFKAKESWRGRAHGVTRGEEKNIGRQHKLGITGFRSEKMKGNRKATCSFIENKKKTKTGNARNGKEAGVRSAGCSASVRRVRKESLLTDSLLAYPSNAEKRHLTTNGKGYGPKPARVELGTSLKRLKAVNSTEVKKERIYAEGEKIDREERLPGYLYLE